MNGLRSFSLCLCTGALIAGSVFVSAAPRAQDETVQRLSAEAYALAGDYQVRLQAVLGTAIKSGGPVGAIGSCRLQAPTIAEALSGDAWTVRRTALKVRNPQNAPTPWEKERLQEMEQGLAVGAEADSLIVGELQEQEEGHVFYYMQPIMTGQICLNCHGDKLSASVRKALSEQYPEDKATGFSVGELRGAFSFTRILGPVSGASPGVAP